MMFAIHICVLTLPVEIGILLGPGARKRASNKVLEFAHDFGTKQMALGSTDTNREVHSRTDESQLRPIGTHSGAFITNPKSPGDTVYIGFRAERDTPKHFTLDV